MRRASLRAAVLALLVGAAAGCSDSPSAPRVAGENNAGRWRTFVLANGAEFRPTAPPSDGSPEAQGELNEIVRLQSQRTPATDSLVQAAPAK